MKRLLATLFVVTASFRCGGGETTCLEPGCSAGGGRAEAAGGGSGGGSPGGGSSTGGGTATSGPTFDTPYFPMQDGLSWQYRAQLADGGTGSDCLNDGTVYTVTMTAVADGMLRKWSPASCGYYTADITFSVMGNDIYSMGEFDNFKFPPTLNQTWPSGGGAPGEFTWDQQLATWQVNGTTYSDCWRFTLVNQDSHDIVCKNVGVVEMLYRDSRLELLSKSF